MPNPEVVIVGAGLAGLCCALRLQQAGVSCRILEASDAPGGRVRTDVVDGFLLDRGFQVMLTAYPEAQRMLDYSALQFGQFHSGAIIRAEGKFHRFGDPSRHLADAVPTLLAPVGSLADKLRVAALRSQVTSGSLEDIYQHPETTTLQKLTSFGFSETMIQRFFRPFFRGIFLEPDLATSSRKFEFVFRMFSEGHAALPAAGMQAVPQQLVHKLKPGTLLTNTRVVELQEGGVRLKTGELIPAECIVLATEGYVTADLLRQPNAQKACSVTCIYYAAPQSPVDGPWLVLNGENSGPINNLCVPSEVNRSYAPAGQSLVSVTVLGDTSGVEAQLTEWYGPVVSKWRHLRTLHIPYALPEQVSLDPVEKPPRVTDRLYVCGDHMNTASIQGAMVSGRRAAEAILAS